MIRKLLPLLVIVTALLGIPAQATTYWGSPSQVGSGHSGVDSTLNAFTLAEINAKTDFLPGDKIRFRTGTYTGDFNPSSAGSAAGFLVFEGWPSAPGAVTFTGQLVIDSTAAGQGDYIVVRGVTFNGEASIGPSSGRYHARWDSLTWCDLKGGLTVAGGYSFIHNTTIGDGVIMEGVQDRLVINYEGTSFIWQNFQAAKRVQFQDCTFNLITTGATSTNMEVRFRDSLSFLRCRSLQKVDAGGGNAHLMTFYGMTNSQITDCYFGGLTLAGANVYMYSARDNFHHNTFTRDTIEEIAGGVGMVQVGMMTSGSAIAGEYNGRNVYNNCRYRVRGMLEYQDVAGTERHFGGVYVCGVMGTSSWGVADSLWMRHCTVVGFGVRPWGADAGSVADNVTIKGNIFWSSLDLGTGANGYVQYLNYTPGAVDSNLYWSTSQDSGLAINGPGGGETYQVGEASTWCSVRSNDCGSEWADPFFAYTADIVNFNATPDSAWEAVNGHTWPDEYVGAIDPRGAPDAPDEPPPPLEITTASPLPTGTLGLPYSVLLETGGGMPPYGGWYVHTGSLPAGLEVQEPGSNGYIAGTPTAAAVTVFTLGVYDAENTLATKEFSLTTEAVATLAGLSITTTDSCAGIQVLVMDDADSSHTVVMTYGLTDPPEWTPPAAVRSYGHNIWATSLFGLQPNSVYNVRIQLYDQSATLVGTKDTTFTTKRARWWQQDITGPLFYVDATSGSDANPGTALAPFVTIEAAWAELISQPNAGRGGGLVISGEYYGRGTVSGGSATPDTMYHIIGADTSGSMIMGVDVSVYVTASRGITANATGMPAGYYKGRYAGTDSMGGLWVVNNGTGAITRMYKCDSMTTFLQGLGVNTGGTYNLIGDFRYFLSSTDSIYTYFGGDVPTNYQFMPGYDAGLAVATPYVRIHGLKFGYCGGNWRFPETPIYIQSNYVVVDSCIFVTGAVYPNVYSLAKDSCIVANNVFRGDTYRAGYEAGKDSPLHENEGEGAVSTSGDSWYITGNNITDMFNGLRLYGSLASTSSGSEHTMANNVFTRMADDAIEVDISRCINTRIYKNKTTRSNTLVSLTSTYGGPLWICYNTASHLSSTPGGLKLSDGMCQTFVYHNTIFANASTSAYWNDGGGNRHFRNNILVGSTTTRPPVYCTTDVEQEITQMATNTFGYNILWNLGNANIWMRWPVSGTVTGVDSTTLRTTLGYETQSAMLGTPYFADTTFATLNLGITGIRGRDAALPIPGINDRAQFRQRIGAAADVGAYEAATPATPPSVTQRGWLRRFVHIFFSPME